MYKTKVDYRKNYMLASTIGSNAFSFIKIKTMNGLEMCNKLLSIFQGK